LICPHGLRTCNICKPGITNYNNLITRHAKERETSYGNTAAEFLALTEEKQSELSRDFMYLRDKAVIESSSEEKRSVIRSAKQQVEQLCCKLPFAFCQINAFLEPYKTQIFPEGRPASLAINGFACSGGVKSTTREVLSNVVRSKQKGPFTSTDGKYRKFTDDAEVDLQFLVEKHKEDIAKGRMFVDSRHDAVLACVFYSLPTKVRPGGFAEGRMHERGLILWIRERSEYCHDLNFSSGGAGRTPNDVATCGGSAWFTGGPTEVVAKAV
jgi:hypothetical protein